MKLMVIDGNSIVNRAFYGVSQNLTTQEGLPTNAIFGFLNILFKLLDEEQPQGLAVASAWSPAAAGEIPRNEAVFFHNRTRPKLWRQERMAELPFLFA